MAGGPGGAVPGGAGTAPAPSHALVAADHLVAVRQGLAHLDGEALTERERVDVIAELERLKGAVSAAQARVTHALRVSREAAQPKDAIRSVGSEVALARRCSPTLGDRFVGLARALVTEMPHTHAALTEGVCSERHVVFMVQATSVLSAHDRAEVDRRVGPLLGRLGVKAAERAARRVAAELDAAAVVRRMKDAVRSRRVTVRPAPDGMAYLTVLGPLVEVVGAHAALQARAKAVVGGQCPDEHPGGRRLGAVAADTALGLLSGRLAPGHVQPVEVHLVMTDRALLGTGDPRASTMEPARIPGHGSLPAPTARAWLRGASSTGAVGGTEADAAGGAEADAVANTDANAAGGAEADAAGGAEADAVARTDADAAGVADAPEAVWLRRLYTSPDGRDLVAMDSRRRLFRGLLRRMLVLRDDVCTTPWCESPIAHADHGHPAREGGATSFALGNGACARCNLVREAPGWHRLVVGIDPERSSLRPSHDASESFRAAEVPKVPSASNASGTPKVPQAPKAPTDPVAWKGDTGRRQLEIRTPAGRVHPSAPPPLLGWGTETETETATATTTESGRETPSTPEVGPDETTVSALARVSARAGTSGPTRRPVRRSRRTIDRARPPRRPRLTSHLERELCRYIR